MASIEYIQKRIEGKEKEIQKLEKKLERIEKAKASNWEDNPYGYDEYDLKFRTRDLEEAKIALENYKKDLATAQEKAGSRNVKPILDYLESWKQRVTEYYKQEYKKYLVELEDWYKEDRANTDWWNNGGFRDPNRKQIEETYWEHRKAFYTKWAFIQTYLGAKNLDDMKLEKDLTQEANRKYDFIIERTNEIVGQITDASGLRIGSSGELNGWIKGTRGTAEVETIGAGGYNIQCYHFRTLIKPKK